MTETPQNPPAPPEEGGDESGQEGGKPGPVNAPDSTGDSIGFKVYDKTLKRFVGPLASSKSAANKGVSKVKGHDYEVREV